MEDELKAEMLRALGVKHAARAELEAAREAEAEAKAALREAKRAYEAACRTVEEIEEEVLHGKTGLPILDAAAAASKASPAVWASGRPPSTAGADAKLREAIRPERRDRPDPWAEARARGSLGDLEALAILTEIWPREGLLGNGWSAKGGHQPAFWDTDHSSADRKPPLWERAELAAAVRRALDLPLPPEDRPAAGPAAASAPSAADAVPVRRRRKAEARGVGARP